MALRLLALSLLTGALLCAQTKLEIPASTPWTDSGLDVQPGDSLTFTATGTIQFPQSAVNGPDGLGRGWKDLLRILPLNEAGRGALIGRVGDGDSARIFLIGAAKDINIAAPGRLYLGVNEPASEPASGVYHVAMTVRKAAAVPPSELARLPDMTADLLAKLPTRIADKAGNPGDRVNLLILGSEEKVRQTFDGAGWVQVDRTVKDAALHGLLASLSKRSYTQLPMSELYLFGRPQDFGFAHAEPFAVIASRHHLRLWKSDLTVAGLPVWVGAATHDIGFEKDQRNGKLTHKIDSDIDKEREYVAQTLLESGYVSATGYVQQANAVKEAHTATGGSFFSDGRTLVLRLATTMPTPANARERAFGDTFCSVLKQENPDSGDWGDCSAYLQSGGQPGATLGPITTRYRLLIVPGFMNVCAAAAPAFREGQEHLRSLGMTVEMLSVPNDTSEANGVRISQYVAEHWKDDIRPYIVLGYSKGAPDLQVALAQDQQLAARVAALITVAGAIGGSPIADMVPAQVQGLLRRFSLGQCMGDVGAGFTSLRRDVRQAFLTRFPKPIVPTYSLAAASDASNTSKMLMESWRLLSVYDSQQDSQLTRADSIAPGAIDLGTARADHLAVALPFEKADDPMLRAVVDHGHYPRSALLEALVRFVLQDLSPR